jgi:hypothetical protein
MYRILHFCASRPLPLTVSLYNWLFSRSRKKGFLLMAVLLTLSPLHELNGKLNFPTNKKKSPKTFLIS